MGEAAQFITSLATLFGVLGGLYLSYRNSQKIEIVHKATNSMKDELVDAVKIAAHAKGVSDERNAATRKRRDSK